MCEIILPKTEEEQGRENSMCGQQGSESRRGQSSSWVGCGDQLKGYSLKCAHWAKKEISVTPHSL